MQNKAAFATIAVFTTALFGATLATALTIQSAAGQLVCSPRNPNVCAASGTDLSSATTTSSHPVTGHSNTALSGTGASCVNKNGHGTPPGTLCGP